MRLFFPTLLVVLVLLSDAASSQSSFITPLLLRNGNSLYSARFGVSSGSTIGADRDTLLGPFLEALAPPLPPEYQLDVRFRTIPGRNSTYPTGLGSGMYMDFREYRDPAQVDSFQIRLAADGPNNGLINNTTVIEWPADLARYGTGWQMIGLSGTPLPQTDMLATSSVSIPADQLAGFYNILIVKTGALYGSLPAASDIRTVTSTGVVNFGVQYSYPYVALGISSLTGTGVIQVDRYASGPLNVGFDGGSPANVSQYRWVIKSVGITGIEASAAFDWRQFKSGVTNPNSVTVYWRPTEGTGNFSALPTSFADSVVSASAGAFGEFIFGSPDNLLTGVGEEVDGTVPRAFELGQNYPNPFNPSTTISFGIAATAFTTIKVYTILGQEIRTLLAEKLEPGRYSVRFDAAGLPSGAYIYRMQSGGSVLANKMLFVK